jgi:hypothetical protein
MQGQETEEGSVALTRATARATQVGFGGLFDGVSRRVIGRRKFEICKFVTMKLSGAYRAPGSVIGGPHNLK